MKLLLLANWYSIPQHWVSLYRAALPRLRFRDVYCPHFARVVHVTHPTRTKKKLKWEMKLYCEVR